VTFQIRQLEEYFDTRLFDRAQGRITLTAAGVVALEYAERILGLSAELDARMKEMSGQVGGPLLIGASMTVAEFLLPPVLGEFKARFPAVLPRLLVGNSEAVQERVAERTLDLGFIESGSPLSSLQSEVCCEDELHVVCAPSHPLAKEPYASPAALIQHPYIGREAGSGTRLVVDRYFQQAGVSPDAMNRVVELGSPEAIKGLVATGMGFAILSQVITAKEIQLGQLAQVPLKPALIRNFSVVYARERFHSKLVAAFLAFAKERLAAGAKTMRQLAELQSG
jgi:DNA-binding transcriptional LysR family regulator